MESIKNKEIYLLSQSDVLLFFEIYNETPKKCRLYKMINGVLHQKIFDSDKFYKCEFRLNQIELDDKFIKLIVDTIYKAHKIVPEIKTSDEFEPQTYGVKLDGAIESEVGSLTNRYFYENLSLTPLGILDFISTLLLRLVKRHIFHNGNKRTAILTIAYLFNQFGFYIYQAKNNDIYIKDWEDFMLNIADSNENETIAVEKIKQILKSKIWFKL